MPNLYIHPIIYNELQKLIVVAITISDNTIQTRYDTILSTKSTRLFNIISIVKHFKNQNDIPRPYINKLYSLMPFANNIIELFNIDLGCDTWPFQIPKTYFRNEENIYKLYSGILQYRYLYEMSLLSPDEAIAKYYQRVENSKNQLEKMKRFEKNKKHKY